MEPLFKIPSELAVNPKERERERERVCVCLRELNRLSEEMRVLNQFLAFSKLITLRVAKLKLFKYTYYVYK